MARAIILFYVLLIHRNHLSFLIGRGLASITYHSEQSFLSEKKDPIRKEKKKKRAPLPTLQLLAPRLALAVQTKRRQDRPSKKMTMLPNQVRPSSCCSDFIFPSIFVPFKAHINMIYWRHGSHKRSTSIEPGRPRPFVLSFQGHDVIVHVPAGISSVSGSAAA